MERPPPELDVVIVGGEKHHRVAWGQSVPFSTASHVSLRLSGGGSASCSLAGLNAGDRKWLACSTRGHVLLEVRSGHAEEDEDDEEVVATPHNPYELGAVWAVAQAVARLFFAPQLAADDSRLDVFGIGGGAPRRSRWRGRRRSWPSRPLR